MSPQCSAILRHLKRFKTITTLQAYRMGICCLHKRISEIRDAGYQIGGYMVEVKSRFGPTRVKRYYLVKS